MLTGTLALATILTALPVTAVHASGNQYWMESAERVGYIEQIMNDGSIKSTFHNLYSDVQRADDVVVVLPAKAGEKHFLPEQKVKLINPVVDTVANANYRGADVDWYVKADDIVLKSKENHNIDSP
ncbi:YdcP family protein [Holdemanella biformis]|uniref:YdcP family protein n=1 Tax=Holdemanella biformis TaxID=1735 RepID=UPI003CC830A2